MCPTVQAAESCFSGKPAYLTLSHICAVCWESLLSFLFLKLACLHTSSSNERDGHKIQRNSNLLSIFPAPLDWAFHLFVSWNGKVFPDLLPLHAPSFSFLSLYYHSATHIALLLYLEFVDVSSTIVGSELLSIETGCFSWLPTLSRAFST